MHFRRVHSRHSDSDFLLCLLDPPMDGTLGHFQITDFSLNMLPEFSSNTVKRTNKFSMHLFDRDFEWSERALISVMLEGS